MQLLLAGDLVPTASNKDAFINGQVDKILSDGLLELWLSADLRVFNLETPLTDKGEPITKHGPNLIAASKTIKGIVALKPSLVTMANNHIMDQGESGLKSTVSLLEQHTIPYTGVGMNLNQASKGYIFEHLDQRIGVYACSDIEFTIATNKLPGANPFDPLESLDHIQAMKSNVDYLVVLYHGGKEHYRYPSPNLRKICRKMAEKGADLVIAQHSHCIGSYEKYLGSEILYGQGNFVFSKNNNEFWNSGLLVSISFEKEISTELIPFIKTDSGARLANENERSSILNDLSMRSDSIKSDNFVELEYAKYAEKHLNTYLRSIRNSNKIISKFDRVLFKNKGLDSIYGKKTLMAVRNYLECEAHRELFLTGIRIKGIMNEL